MRTVINSRKVDPHVASQLKSNRKFRGQAGADQREQRQKRPPEARDFSLPGFGRFGFCYLSPGPTFTQCSSQTHDFANEVFGFCRGFFDSRFSIPDFFQIDFFSLQKIAAAIILSTFNFLLFLLGSCGIQNIHHSLRQLRLLRPGV